MATQVKDKRRVEWLSHLPVLQRVKPFLQKSFAPWLYKCIGQIKLVHKSYFYSFLSSHSLIIKVLFLGIFYSFEF